LIVFSLQWRGPADPVAGVLVIRCRRRWKAGGKTEQNSVGRLSFLYLNLARARKLVTAAWKLYLSLDHNLISASVIEERNSWERSFSFLL
jgi:hypothetical protein